MLKSLKNCLAFDVIATRAILVCGITVFSTSSILALYINEVMLKSLKNCLAFDVIAARAILMCGITVFGTCSSLSLYVNKIVSESFKNCLTFGVITTRAILVRGITVFGTCSSLSLYVNKIVIESRNFLCVRIATFASECLNTCCSTCSGSSHGFCVVSTLVFYIYIPRAFALTPSAFCYGVAYFIVGRNFKVVCLIPSIIPTIIRIIGSHTAEYQVGVSMRKLHSVNSGITNLCHTNPSISITTKEVNCKTSVCLTPVAIRYEVNNNRRRRLIICNSFIKCFVTIGV